MAMEGELANGLIVGHAYSVTDAKNVRHLLVVFTKLENKLPTTLTLTYDLDLQSPASCGHDLSLIHI